MTSNINQNTIDSAYPVAGQDNDSQGFRTNFTSIKNNFAFARSEITDLQNKVIVKAALDGVALDNDMAGVTLKSALVLDFREQRAAVSVVGTTATVNHAAGHYQTLTTTGGALTLQFTNFPTATPSPGKMGRVRVEVSATVGHTLTLPASVTVGIEGVQNLSGDTITFSASGVYIYEFTSSDGGINYTINELTRSRVPAESRTPTGVGAAGDVAGMIAFDSGNIYVCIADYDGSSVIWKKASLGSI